MSAARKALELPQFDLTLYFGPLTQADMEAVEARDPSSRFEENTLLVIQKAETETGERAFAWGDKHYLMNDVPLMVMQQIVAHMYQVGVADVMAGSAQQAAISQALAEGKETSKETSPEPAGSASG